jgi:hypothetical protein
VSFCANDAETELDAIKAVFGIGMVKSMLAIPELAPGAWRRYSSITSIAR